MTRDLLIAASEAYRLAVAHARTLPEPERSRALRDALARLKEEYAKIETEEVRL